jgi:DNA-binding IclR family transcriptional regulator
VKNTRWGISAIGTAIIGFEGEIAAITIPTPTVRFTKKQPELEKALKLCCDAVERNFGRKHRWHPSVVLQFSS